MELEHFWNRLRPPRLEEKTPPKRWDLLGAITRAAAKANEELAGKFPGLSHVVTAAVQTFLEAWYEELRHGDTVSLIGVVLEGRDLTEPELRDFIRALPASLVQRICESATPEASGMQALLALEHERRKGNIRDYTLRRDPLDNKLMVEFYPVEAMGKAVVFKLDEYFEGVTDPGVTPT